jgi:hypothetical protein
MPARPVNLKHDALLLAGASRLGEIGENEFSTVLPRARSLVAAGDTTVGSGP